MREIEEAITMAHQNLTSISRLRSSSPVTSYIKWSVAPVILVKKGRAEGRLTLLPRLGRRKEPQSDLPMMDNPLVNQERTEPAQRSLPQPIRGHEGASIIGPANPAREAESRDKLAPPSTDHGTLPNLKWSFADCHNRLQPGGWARQTTGRELPIAQALFGAWHE